MGGELVKPASPLTYTEQFKQHLPFYLSIGMTYDQYWDGDCELPKFYRQAHELRLRQTNHHLWLQGMYFYEALCDVSPILHAFAEKGTKPHPYPSKPYAVSRQEMQEQAETNRRKAKAVFEAWAASLKNLPEGSENA